MSKNDEKSLDALKRSIQLMSVSHKDYKYEPISNHTLMKETIKKGMDGNFYAIVKEGQSYFIKKHVIKESKSQVNESDYVKSLSEVDFVYIGGKNNILLEKTENFKSASERLNLKLKSIAEGIKRDMKFSRILKENEDIKPEEDVNDEQIDSEEMSAEVQEEPVDSQEQEVEVDQEEEVVVDEEPKEDEEVEKPSLNQLAGRFPQILDSSEDDLQAKKSAINQMFKAMFDFASKDAELSKSFVDYVKSQIEEVSESKQHKSVDMMDKIKEAMEKNPKLKSYYEKYTKLKEKKKEVIKESVQAAINNNNPFGLFSNVAFTGKVGQEGGFDKFSSMALGIKAGLKNLAFGKALKGKGFDANGFADAYVGSDKNMPALKKELADNIIKMVGADFNFDNVKEGSTDFTNLAKAIMTTYVGSFDESLFSKVIGSNWKSNLKTDDEVAAYLKSVQGGEVEKVISQKMGNMERIKLSPTEIKVNSPEIKKEISSITINQVADDRANILRKNILAKRFSTSSRDIFQMFTPETEKGTSVFVIKDGDKSISISTKFDSNKVSYEISVNGQVKKTFSKEGASLGSYQAQFEKDLQDVLSEVQMSDKVKFFYGVK